MVSPSLGAGDPELAAIPLFIEDGEEILIDSISYFFSTEPQDGRAVSMWLRLGDATYLQGHVVENNTSLYLSAFWTDRKTYQMGAGTSWISVESNKFVDLEPDVFLAGDDQQLEFWLECNGSVTCTGQITLFYVKKITQKITPNDNAYSDISFEEMAGSVQVWD